MIAVDTNVLVRLLVADDPHQTRRAKALASRGPLFVPVTVLLETEWVLRALYQVARGDIERGFRTLLDVADVEDAADVARALDLFGQRLDFADALHVVRSGRASAFVSFDEKLVKRAKGLHTKPTVRRP